MIITAAGHITLDKVITKEQQFLQLGGPPSFMSSIDKLIDSRIEVVTQISPYFPLIHPETMKERGVDLIPWTCNAPTTRFILEYTVNPRGLVVVGVCDDIQTEDIPDSGCVTLSLIAGEINECARALFLM